MAVLEQLRHALFDPLGSPELALGLGISTGSPTGQFRSFGGQTLAKLSDDTQYHLVQFLEDVELTHLMWHAAEELGQRHWVQGRTIRGDPVDGTVAGEQHVSEPTQEAADIVVVGVMIEYVVEQPPLVGAVHRTEHAKWAIVHLVENQVAGEVGQRPISVGLKPCVCLFFPLFRPSSGWWHRGRRRGGHATDARMRCGTAIRPPPPDERPR